MPMCVRTLVIITGWLMEPSDYHQQGNGGLVLCSGWQWPRYRTRN